MIHTVLNVLRGRLNEYLKIKNGSSNDDDDLVKYIISENNGSVSFANNVITPFLINVSEDRKFRNSNQYSGVIKDGVRTQINPEVRIELQVLFVSKFSDYNQALYLLSYVIKYFQSNRVFSSLDSPELANENIEKLTIELITLPLEEQNQVWHSLNTSYLPSVLYKVRVLSFIDDESAGITNVPVNEIDFKISKKTI